MAACTVQPVSAGSAASTVENGVVRSVRKPAAGMDSVPPEPVTVARITAISSRPWRVACFTPAVRALSCATTQGWPLAASVGSHRPRSPPGSRPDAVPLPFSWFA